MQARTGSGWRRNAWRLTGTGLVLAAAASVYGTDPNRTDPDAAPRLREAKSVFFGVTQIAAEQGIPVAPAVRALPSRQVEPLLEREQIEIDTARNLRSLGGTPITARAEGSVAGGIPQPGDPCITELECEDCEPCTFDRCRPGKCSSGSTNSGFPCSIEDQCIGGTCEFFRTCAGGTADGDDCSTPAGVTACTNGGGTCPTSGRELRCVRIQEGAGAAGECSDGFTCNGREQCTVGGLCETITACPIAGQVCDPNRNDGSSAIGVCGPACSTNANCDDAAACNGVETCDVPSGICSRPPRPCGEGAPCAAGAAAGSTICGVGRCCDDTNLDDCTRTTAAACVAPGKHWLGVGDRQSTPPIATSTEDDNPLGCTQLVGAQDELFEGEDLQCPQYASGITPRGPLTVRVGRIEAADCEPLQEVGDDYEIELIESGKYFELTTMRFIGGFFPGVGFDRTRITFYDSAGNFIEDSITDSQASVTGIVLRTFIWSEKPIIPSQGYVTIRPARKFSDDTHAYWMATGDEGDPVDHGNNAAVGMYYRRAGDTHAQAQVTVDLLGRCSLGTRAGEYCDRRNGNADCPGGTCTDVPDILAFELVGNEVDPPLGACCIVSTGSCELELPWVCEAQGNAFQGVGTLCKACSGDNFTSCTNDTACVTCHGGSQNNQPCNTGPLVTACVNGGGACPGGTCLPFLPACTTIACCNTATGACSEVAGRCVDDNSPCEQDSDCSPSTCTQTCPVGTVGQGFGTECVPNCCEQPVFTGADDCFDTDLHVFAVNPDPNVTQTRTITGDNSTAVYNPDSCNLLGGPLGGINDQMWVEGFTIDQCANVRVDFCCSDPLHEPQWFTLLQGCPCERFVAGDAVPSPIGLLDTDGSERGLPFCDKDDNLWSTYGPLPAGTYYIPVLSALDGVFGSYQMHITVAACTRAACCVPTPVCLEPDGDLELSGGQVVLCPVGNECAGGNTCAADCIEANEPDCGSANGYWLHFRNLPEGTAPIVSCASNRCNIGSCCDGTDCEDRATVPTPCNPGNPSTCMSRTICDSTDGRFVGGALCSYPRDPCPACEVETVSQCQLRDGGEDYELGTLSDLFVGQMAADDFIPQEGSISTLCITGQYVSELEGTSAVKKCGVVDPEPGVVDKFLVRVYANDPATNMPGTLIGERTATVALKGLDHFTSYLEWHKMQLVLSSPISGLSIGQCHWLEVTNNTDETSVPNSANRCRFYWATHIPDTGSHVGNRYSAVAPAVPAGLFVSSPYALGNHRGLDMIFCLDIPFDANGCGDRLGACCSCNGSTCTDSLELRTCNARTETWHGEDPICTEIAPCGSSVPEGNTCDTNADGTPDGAIVATDGMYVAHTQCATTDGPAEIRGSPFDNDIWYAYTATCTGQLTISMCGSALSYDAFLAAYAHIDSGDRKVCTCPNPATSNVDLWANEAGSDEDCHAGFIGPGYLSERVEKGDCILVRLGGYGAASGDSSLTITCEQATCKLADPPTIVQHDSNPSAPVLLADLRMNRYLGIKIPSSAANQQQAISVYIKTLPAPFNIWDDKELWVQNPVQICETAGSDSVSPPCGPTAATYPRAFLGCSPVFRDWTTVPGGVVYATHPGVIASRYTGNPPVLVTAAEYEIRMVDVGCNLASFDNYSLPAVVVQTKYGDMAGPFDTTGQYYTTAEGTNVGTGTDVTALLRKFQNAGTAPIKARADMEPCRLDSKVNISDVTEGLNGFRNLAYRFGPGGGNCTNLDVCGYGAAQEVAAGE